MPGQKEKRFCISKSRKNKNFCLPLDNNFVSCYDVEQYNTMKEKETSFPGSSESPRWCEWGVKDEVRTLPEWRVRAKVRARQVSPVTARGVPGSFRRPCKAPVPRGRSEMKWHRGYSAFIGLLTFEGGFCFTRFIPSPKQRTFAGRPPAKPAALAKPNVSHPTANFHGRNIHGYYKTRISYSGA